MVSDLHWVFGFGSLMWAPGFPHLARRPARLAGWHRAYSLLSTQAWGTPERPGLIVTLEPGGHCDGVAFGVARRDWSRVRGYLKQRERAYRHVVVPVAIGGGGARALTFVRDPAQARWVGKMAPADAAPLIAQGRGPKGASLDYFNRIVAELLLSRRAVPAETRALQRALCAEIGQFSPFRPARTG